MLSQGWCLLPSHHSPQQTAPLPQGKYSANNKAFLWVSVNRHQFQEPELPSNFTVATPDVWASFGGHSCCLAQCSLVVGLEGKGRDPEAPVSSRAFGHRNFRFYSYRMLNGNTLMSSNFTFKKLLSPVFSPRIYAGIDFHLKTSLFMSKTFAYTKTTTVSLPLGLCTCRAAPLSVPPKPQCRLRGSSLLAWC